MVRYDPDQMAQGDGKLRTVSTTVHSSGASRKIVFPSGRCWPEVPNPHSELSLRGTKSLIADSGAA
jgi:hypothetical protein